MKKLVAALLLFSAAVTPTLAADQGGYVAVDIGRATLSGADFGGNFGNLTFPNPGTIHLDGGYHFDRNFGIEGGLVLNGDSTLNSLQGGVAATETLKTSAVYIAAVGTLPLSDQFDLFGKLGLSSIGVDYSSNAFGSLTQSQGNIMYGLGAQVNVSRNIGIRLQYENFGKVDFPTGTFGLPRTISVGLSTVTVGGVFSF